MINIYLQLLNKFRKFHKFQSSPQMQPPVQVNRSESQTSIVLDKSDSLDSLEHTINKFPEIKTISSLPR